jgi:hypothetical protein
MAGVGFSPGSTRGERIDDQGDDLFVRAPAVERRMVSRWTELVGGP